MAEYERYNTRNVAQKEIYDSYMGILRISPNEINGAEIDDPTQLLNTLYDEDNQKRTQIILSDSDGNVLPIQFQPRAFESNVSLTNPQTLTAKAQNVDVLHVATIISEGKGNLYVANNMTARSTIMVVRDEDLGEETYRHSFVKILSDGKVSNSEHQIRGNGWILYPTECPNDSNYFNDKNKHKLFIDPETVKEGEVYVTDPSLPRYKQVEDTLYTWTAHDHKTKIYNAKEDERVIVGGKYITQLNQFNEEVPIYYTRDYILGHYDGHQIQNVNANNDIKAAWGTDGSESSGKADCITKLSWARFDKLIWDSLNEILTGNVRHTKGRYDELGVDESADPGLREALGFGSSNDYKKNAPLLGTEVPRGMICYHAMPFHRYWFHRTRQALRSFIERRKLSDENFIKNFKNSGYSSLDDFILAQGLSERLSSNYNSSLLIDEIKTLEDYYNSGLITPCPMGTVGFVHSLAKNFILCNGRTVKYHNFPNISLTNEQIFNTKVKKGDSYISGMSASYDSSTGLFKEEDKFTDYSALSAIAKSSGGDVVIKLPNLFALFEKTPRFIRGLNWGVSNNNEEVNILDMYTGISNYTNTQYKTNNTSMEIYSSNNNKHKMVKKLEATDKPYFQTYDHFVKTETHQHNMFSSIEGGTNNELLNQCLHMYHCEETRGGHRPHRYEYIFGAGMNMDRTFSKTDQFSSPSTYYFVSTNEWKNESYLNYNYGRVYQETGLFWGFTPIPNLGLITFNCSIFNNKGDGDSVIINGREVKGERGTHTNIEDKDIYYYYDGEGNRHRLSEGKITPLGGSTDILGLTNKVQLIKTENTSHNTNMIKSHDAEKQRRKFMAMKMNEAEGFIPISVIGKATGYVIYGWSRDERSGSKSASRNTYHDHKYNVASYVMTSCPAPTKNSYWRCWSSIAYLNANKLGVGDVKNYIKNRKDFNENVDYYDVNSVTQLPSQIIYKQYKYGNNGVSVDESCPTPPYMNLLPLIRI